MGFLGSVFGVIGDMAGEMVKETTGVDVSKTINTIKDGRLEDAIYDMKGAVSETQ